ncbi:MAG: aspartate kinase [Ignavibacteria bacterium]|nr:aspartate kinase [Ignavibacteria bacterium]
MVFNFYFCIYIFDFNGIKMQILKFGGAVLSSKKGFEKLIEIIINNNTKPVLVIISAFSKATRNLSKAAGFAESGDEQKAMLAANQVVADYTDIANQLIDSQSVKEKLFHLFDEGIQKIGDLLRGVSIIKELTLKTSDAILSFGEYFALQTVYHFLLEREFNVGSIDSTDVIVTNSDFGNAEPDIEATKRNVELKIKPALELFDLVLTQGFVAKDSSGKITTMGIESSNLTAALYADLLNAEELTIYTDVEGIRTSDPKLIQQTKSVKSMTYEQAFIAAVNGLKLIHPGMLYYLKEKNVRLSFRSAFNPSGEFTLVLPEPNIPDMKNQSTPLLILTDDISLMRYRTFSLKDRKNADKFIHKIFSSGLPVSSLHFHNEALSVFIARQSESLFQKEEHFHSLKPENFSIITIIRAGGILDKCLPVLTSKIITGERGYFFFDSDTDTLKIMTLSVSTGNLLKELHDKIFN